MSNNSELDDLSEREILIALGEEVPPDLDELLGDSKTTNFEGLDELILSSSEEEEEEKEEENIDISDLDILPMDEIESAIENQNDEIDIKTVSYLLNELSNKKNIEITIKVKE